MPPQTNEVCICDVTAGYCWRPLGVVLCPHALDRGWLISCWTMTPALPGSFPPALLTRFVGVRLEKMTFHLFRCRTPRPIWSLLRSTRSRRTLTHTTTTTSPSQPHHGTTTLQSFRNEDQGVHTPYLYRRVLRSVDVVRTLLDLCWGGGAKTFCTAVAG